MKKEQQQFILILSKMQNYNKDDYSKNSNSNYLFTAAISVEQDKLTYWTNEDAQAFISIWVGTTQRQLKSVV